MGSEHEFHPQGRIANPRWSLSGISGVVEVNFSSVRMCSYRCLALHPVLAQDFTHLPVRASLRDGRGAQQTDGGVQFGLQAVLTGTF